MLQIIKIVDIDSTWIINDTSMIITTNDIIDGTQLSVKLADIKPLIKSKHVTTKNDIMQVDFNDVSMHIDLKIFIGVNNFIDTVIDCI